MLFKNVTELSVVSFTSFSEQQNKPTGEEFAFSAFHS